MFKVNTDGTDYTVLKHFTGGDGQNPTAGLTLSGRVLYGTASQGGELGLGTVFKLDLRPILLTLLSLGNTVVLSWTEPAFALQAAPAVTGVFTNILGATSPHTNLITGGQRFFGCAPTDPRCLRYPRAAVEPIRPTPRYWRP